MFGSALSFLHTCTRSASAVSQVLRYSRRPSATADRRPTLVSLWTISCLRRPDVARDTDNVVRVKSEMSSGKRGAESVERMASSTRRQTSSTGFAAAKSRKKDERWGKGLKKQRLQAGQDVALWDRGEHVNHRNTQKEGGICS